MATTLIRLHPDINLRRIVRSPAFPFVALGEPQKIGMFHPVLGNASKCIACHFGEEWKFFFWQSSLLGVTGMELAVLNIAPVATAVQFDFMKSRRFILIGLVRINFLAK